MAERSCVPGLVCRTKTIYTVLLFLLWLQKKIKVTHISALTILTIYDPKHALPFQCPCAMLTGSVTGGICRECSCCNYLLQRSKGICSEQRFCLWRFSRQEDRVSGLSRECVCVLLLPRPAIATAVRHCVLPQYTVAGLYPSTIPSSYTPHLSHLSCPLPSPQIL